MRARRIWDARRSVGVEEVVDEVVEEGFGGLRIRARLS